jgi:photosystem II stability/assembly factor-like uncharacterized protein
MSWKTVHNGDQTLGGLRGVAFTDANHGTAVGGMGIWRTTDGGVTWNNQFRSGVGRMYGIIFMDANTAMSVGDGGVIVRADSQ